MNYKRIFTFMLAFVTILTLNPINAHENFTITYRETDPHDFITIHNFSIQTLAQLYNLSTQDELDALSNNCRLIFQEEEIALKSKQMISFIASYNDRVIGYISAHSTDISDELYLKFFIVDANFQRQGIGRKLIQQCLKLLPNTIRIVLMTNKKNPVAQNFYDNLGGQRIHNPSWQKYLPSTTNPTDYIGFELAQKQLRALI